MTIKEKAEAYLMMFDRKTRDNGDSFVILGDNATKLLCESVRDAHGERLPNDWTYGTYADLMQQVTEYELNTIDDLEDVRHEIIDSYVDIYTDKLTEWLHDNVNNVHYLTDAMEQAEGDGFNLLQMAQYMAIEEVMNEVVSLLSSNDPELG